MCSYARLSSSEMSSHPLPDGRGEPSLGSVSSRLDHLPSGNHDQPFVHVMPVFGPPECDYLLGSIAYAYRVVPTWSPGAGSSAINAKDGERDSTRTVLRSSLSTFATVGRGWRPSRYATDLWIPSLGPLAGIRPVAHCCGLTADR